MLSTVVTACGERPPIDWMYAEYKSLTSLCQGGRRVSEKSSTASLIYTWSCPHPKNLEVWLSEFETKHLNPRGWQKGKLPPPPYAWITYCISDRNVLMRIVVMSKCPQHLGRRIQPLFFSKISFSGQFFNGVVALFRLRCACFLHKICHSRRHCPCPLRTVLLAFV